MSFAALFSQCLATLGSFSNLMYYLSPLQSKASFTFKCIHTWWALTSIFTNLRNLVILFCFKYGGKVSSLLLHTFSIFSLLSLIPRFCNLELSDSCTQLGVLFWFCSQKLLQLLHCLLQLLHLHDQFICWMFFILFFKKNVKKGIVKNLLSKSCVSTSLMSSFDFLKRVELILDNTRKNV